MARPPQPKTPTPIASPSEPPKRSLGRIWVPLAVVSLLGLHYALAARSLVRENPTVDEIAHLPAGITYWQKGTFRLYPHNPPLVKLIAAIPVVLAGPDMDPVYAQKSWTETPPSQATFGHTFALVNAARYFELFDAARLVMPLFSLLGGLFVFLWSRKAYGPLGGLLSLALWTLCPNILAHGRLVTSDVAGASFCVASTYLFWRFLRAPGWGWAVASGLALGLAQLTKFSLLLLYGLWPMLWIAKILIDGFSTWSLRRLGREIGFGVVIVLLSLLTINAGYGFEGVGTPLGKFEFISKSLTREIPTRTRAVANRNPLMEMAWQHRTNRFRGTALENLPVPLPYHYLAGFDEQKIESEGLPAWWNDPKAPKDETTGYSVYLNGTLRQTGWWYYYLATLAYKIPEGTWAVLLLSFVALTASRGRSVWFDELAVLAVPCLVLFAMSTLTDINLGLRYILPVLPFLFVGAGRVVPWIAGMRAGLRKPLTILVAVSLVGTVAATASIRGHYLAYFNQFAGGPDRGAEHLIDSNLDWGQDLVGLREWLETSRPGQRIGLAYFGQINPSIFFLRGQPFPWFIPPVRPGTIEPMVSGIPLIGPEKVLKPGLYAVSATLLKGLPWRIYDPILPPQMAWGAAWNANKMGAFSYFDGLTPIAKIGYSIFVYELTEADCGRLNPLLTPPDRPNPPSNPPPG